MKFKDYLNENKLTKVEKGWYRTNVGGVDINIIADYETKTTGYSKNPQSWSFRIGKGKAIKGAKSKKHALDLAIKHLKK